MSLGSDDDDLLIEADALLAQGDSRGELIVIQCELARGGFDHVRGRALRDRERELLVKHAALADLEGLGSEPVFRRGHIEEMTADVRTYVSRGKEIWTRAPRLRRLRLTGLTHRARLVNRTPDPSDARELCYWLERVLDGGDGGKARVKSLALVAPEVVWSELAYPDHRRIVSDYILDWLIATKRIEHLEGLELPSVAANTLEKLRPYAQLADLRLTFAGDGPIACEDLGDLRPRRLAIDTEHGGPSRYRPLLHSGLLEKVVDLDFPFLAFMKPIARQLVVARGRGGDLSAITDADEFMGLEELELHVGRESDFEALHEPQRLDALRVLRIVGPILPDQLAALHDSILGRRLEAIETKASDEYEW